MAEQLSQLNQSHDSQTPRITSPPRQQDPTTPRTAEAPEIYHSLEDSLPLRKSEQPEGPSDSATPASLALPNPVSGNAPMTGQTCQYVDELSPSSSRRALVLTWIVLTILQQLRDHKNATMAAIACGRDHLQCLRFVFEGAQSVPPRQHEAQHFASCPVYATEPSPRPKPRQKYFP
jgi:hypothetical protein